MGTYLLRSYKELVSGPIPELSRLGLRTVIFFLKHECVQNLVGDMQWRNEFCGKTVT